MAEYPTDEELVKVQAYDDKAPIKEFVEYLASISNYDAVRWRFGKDGRHGKKLVKVEYHTFGWSGNEDIIEVLQKTDNLFWFLWWRRSDRGGHYYFEIPLWAWEGNNGRRRR